MSVWSKTTLSQHFYQLSDGFYRVVRPIPLDRPHWVHWNSHFATQLNLPSQPNQNMLNNFSGIQLPEEFTPIAMKYAGHQFGQYNQQLGDGRGLLLTEIQSNQNEIYDLHIKGSGLTPFSRQGDGRAALRSSIREYLCSEALFHLGIPTTRALGLINSKRGVKPNGTKTYAKLLSPLIAHLPTS